MYNDETYNRLRHQETGAVNKTYVVDTIGTRELFPRKTQASCNYYKKPKIEPKPWLWKTETENRTDWKKMIKKPKP